MIKEFIEQTSIEENLLKYDAGKVCEYDDNIYLIKDNQNGARRTFSGCP